MFESCSHIEVFTGGIVISFGLIGRMLPIGPSRRRLLKQSTQSRVAYTASNDLHGPRRYHLGLVEAVDRFGQRVVVAVADAADRRMDPGFGQAIGAFDRQVLDAAVAVMHEARFPGGLPGMYRLFQSIQNEAGMGRAVHPPSDDPACEGIDHEGYIDQPGRGRDIGDVRHRFASRALALGESLSMIGELLGHNKIDTTARYAQLARDSTKASSARVADSIVNDILNGKRDETAARFLAVTYTPGQ